MRLAGHAISFLAALPLVHWGCVMILQSLVWWVLGMGFLLGAFMLLPRLFAA